nr:FmdB family zinc ribbon protein [Cellulomonas sp. 73-92]
MPTYAYTCTVCDHSFDVHQSFADAPLTVCPECSGRLRKVFSPVGVVFKGSGFYRTDARSSTKSTVSAGTSSSSGSSGSSGSSSSSSSGTTSPAASSSSPTASSGSAAKAASA